MSSTPPTFSTLRALHLLVGQAIDDIQRVFSQPYSASTTALSSTLSDETGCSPVTSSTGAPIVDYPSPDKSFVPASLPEQLAAHPDAAAAAMRIVAACGQMSNIVHKPFMSLSEALLSYNLPACLRLVENLHVVEILREAEDKRQRPLASRKKELPQDPRDSTTVGEDALLPSTDSKQFLTVHESVNSALLRPTDQNANLAHCMNEETGVREETAPFEGMHVADLTRVIHAHTGNDHIDPSNLAHALRFLSAHHLLRETSPDTFALTRVMSLLDTGKSVEKVFSSPETKYEDTNGIAAMAGMSTDEIFKSATYLTEAFTGVQLPNPPAVAFRASPADHGTKEVEGISSPSGANCSHQTVAFDIPKEHHNITAFNLAFRTEAPFFEWLESQGKDPLGGTGVGAGHTSTASHSCNTVMRSSGATVCDSSKSFRLERFSKSMLGTTGMEAPGAILSAFDWQSLPNGSTIIDIGGGIGSTTMILARAFDGSRTSVGRENNASEGLELPQAITTHRNRTHGTQPSDSSLSNSDELQDECAPKDALSIRFIVQDRPAVVGLGLATWRSQCPDMLGSGRVIFQDHDFFQPQPPLAPSHLDRYPAVYLLRAILHDWSDDSARRILLHLRRASGPNTKLVIVDHVIPLGCVDEGVQGGYHGQESFHKSEIQEWTLDSVLAHLEGAERILALPPLLPNMGKANAMVYGMDLVMHILFNGIERTLREFCQLALLAGWRVARMTRSEGSMFGYLVCVPIPLPKDVRDDGDIMETTTSTDPVPASGHGTTVTNVLPIELPV